MRTFEQASQVPGFNRSAWNDSRDDGYIRYYTPQPGDYVLDIGAHVGFFTERLCEWVGKEGWVAAFEPDVTNFKELRQAISEQGCGNCELVNAAAWMKDGYAFLHTNPRNSGGHSIMPRKVYDLPHEQGYAVKTVDIARWDMRTGKSPRFIKLDAEGSELAVLHALLIHMTAPVDIALEVHSRNLCVACFMLLELYGFAVLTDLTEGPKVGLCHAKKLP